jgi:Protein of unknown function (DUF4238)
MKNKPSKNHHYVPEFLIKRFSERNDRFVYVYDKNVRKIEPKPRSASSICYEINLHTIVDSLQNKSLLEDVFSKYENSWATTFRILDENWNEQPLLHDKNARNLLLFFVSCQFWRYPGRKTLVMNSLESLFFQLDKAISTGNLLVDISKKDLKFFIKKSSDTRIQKILQFFIFPCLFFFTDSDDERNFTLIRKPADFPSDFILSDNPIVQRKFEEVLDKKSRILIPFSKDHLLLFAPAGSNDIDCEEIKRMQRTLFENAQRWVIAPSPTALLDYCS